MQLEALLTSHVQAAVLWENDPYVKVQRYNQKYLYPKLNSYGDNDTVKLQRERERELLCVYYCQTHVN